MQLLKKYLCVYKVKIHKNGCVAEKGVILCVTCAILFYAKNQI